MKSVSKMHLTQMKKQQNMTRLGYEEWSESLQTEVPSEPELQITMWVDTKVYAKHKPPLECDVTEEWVDSLEDNQQVDVDLVSTADSGAQVNIIGTDHLNRFGQDIKHLLKSKMTLNCANDSLAGKLGVFIARIKAKHHKTKKLITTKAIVFVIVGDTVLLSRNTLLRLGCIDEDFPEVGRFIDKAAVSKLGCPDQ